MTRDNVIKTYLASFNLYKRLLSLDEQKDDHKRFNLSMCKEYFINDKRARYSHNNQLGLTKKHHCK